MKKRMFYGILIATGIIGGIAFGGTGSFYRFMHNDSLKNGADNVTKDGISSY